MGEWAGRRRRRTHRGQAWSQNQRKGTSRGRPAPLSVSCATVPFTSNACQAWPFLPRDSPSAAATAARTASRAAAPSGSRPAPTRSGGGARTARRTPRGGSVARYACVCTTQIQRTHKWSSAVAALPGCTSPATGSSLRLTSSLPAMSWAISAPAAETGFSGSCCSSNGRFSVSSQRSSASGLQLAKPSARARNLGSMRGA
mmetsp:Transcript_30382/g.76136  ORF Transcript_30382/g.76136 Transcript_30382/m.76136 type:complete len:201 (+) Transcript_30382:379-981(+)